MNKYRIYFRLIGIECHSDVSAFNKEDAVDLWRDTHSSCFFQRIRKLKS